MSIHASHPNYHDAGAQPVLRPPLPTMLTRFVGRQREVAEILPRLVATRCLSLVGAGGSGKTRLAHAVALAVESEFLDGVGWVELAAINDPAFVIQAVARRLNVVTPPDVPLLETLVAKLAARQWLLVLDNCEHLLPACAELVETLLRRTPGQIIVTSREPLGVAGETLYPVPPLTLPAPGQAFAAIAACDAIQFFVERACSIRPDFTLTTANAAAVAELCRELDGMPLAIELASSRLNVLSVQQIAERLERRLDLLVAATRGDPRHRSLRAAIDWSYDLLAPAEQMLLQRLALFASGFTLTTAEAACAWGELDRSQVLELLASLANKSLVMVETIHGREARYRMLETIRQYASQKLDAAGEWTTTHDHYLASFLALAEEVAPKLNEQYQYLWLNWLETEHDNVRVALAWALAHGRIESGLRIALALTRFWEIRSYIQEGLTWFERLFAQMDETIALAVRVNALTFAAFFSYFLGRGETPLAFGRKAVALAENAGAEGAPLLVMALSGLASGYEAMGDYQAAFVTHERVLQLLRQPSPPQTANSAETGSRYDALTLGMTVLTQGGTAIELGDYATAHRYLAESLTLARTANDPIRIAFTFYFSGNLAYCQQQYIEARRHYEQSVALLRRLDVVRDLAAPLQALGYTCLQLN
jgi:predicted ATPase